MPLRFFRTSINIPPGTGRRSFSQVAGFTSNIIRADAALNGFRLDFVGDVDRHINEVEVDVDLEHSFGTDAVVTVECQYADFNFDDPYQGYVTVLVIAEVA
jgi:hypothetical protein